MTTSANGLESGKQELLDIALSNPKVQAVVASATTGMAIDYNIMAWLPPAISISAGVMGLVVSVMIVRHKGIQMKHAKILLEMDQKRHEDMFNDNSKG